MPIKAHFDSCFQSQSGRRERAAGLYVHLATSHPARGLCTPEPGSGTRDTPTPPLTGQPSPGLQDSGPAGEKGPPWAAGRRAGVPSGHGCSVRADSGHGGHGTTRSETRGEGALSSDSHVGKGRNVLLSSPPSFLCPPPPSSDSGSLCGDEPRGTHFGLFSGGTRDSRNKGGPSDASSVAGAA